MPTTEVIPDVNKTTLHEFVNRNVEPSTVVSTNALYSYVFLDGNGYQSGTVF